MVHPKILQRVVFVTSLLVAIFSPAFATGLLLGQSGCGPLTPEERSALTKIAVRGVIALADGACVLVRANTDSSEAEALCVAEEELRPLLPKLFEARRKKASLLAAKDAGSTESLVKTDAEASP